MVHGNMHSIGSMWRALFIVQLASKQSVCACSKLTSNTIYSLFVVYITTVSSSELQGSNDRIINELERAQLKALTVIDFFSTSI